MLNAESVMEPAEWGLVKRQAGAVTGSGSEGYRGGGIQRFSRP